MKKMLLFLFLPLLIVAGYAAIDTQQSGYISSSYDMPTKCKQCGEYHIPGTPCPK